MPINKHANFENKQTLRKVEWVITFILFVYYLAPNIATPMYQAWALFGFITIPVLILSQLKRFLWVVMRDIPLLLLISIVPLSALWSTSIDNTIAYSRAFVYSSAFGIFLATRYSAKEQMKLLVYFLGASLTLNIILPLIVPAYRIVSGGYGWAGITRYKNVLAGLMTITATLFLDLGVYSRKYRQLSIIAAALAVIILVLSEGKGSSAIFVGLLPLIPLYKIVKQEYRVRIICAICAIVVLSTIVIATLINLEFIFVDILGKDTGANGRGEVWDYLIQRGLEKPFLGYGYGGFWTNISEGIGVAVKFPWIGGAGEGGGNAHSSYLEIFLQLGWLGLSLMITSIVTVLYRVILLLSFTRKIEFFWMFQLLLIIAASSSFDSIGFLDYRNWFWVSYVFIAYSSAIHLDRILRTKNKLIEI